MKWDKILSSIVAVLGSIANYFLGGWDLALKTIILFMALDYVLGIMCGGKNKRLSSEVAFNGIFKKVAILIVIAVGSSLDEMVNAEGLLRGLVIFFYIGLEGISILENATLLGVPVPDKLKAALEQLKEGNKKEMVSDD